MRTPSIVEALKGFFEQDESSDFGEWFETKLKAARLALDHLQKRRGEGFGQKLSLIEALRKYDEADDMVRVTSGETLQFWQQQMDEAEEEITEMIDDLGPIEAARHALFSPAL
jgi:hypothetical protein